MIHTDGTPTIANAPRDTRTLQQIRDLPETPYDDNGRRDDSDLVALHGRLYGGLAVQLIWSRVTGQTFLTIDIGGRTDTVEVEPEHALDAFNHPFLYSDLPG